MDLSWSQGLDRRLGKAKVKKAPTASSTGALPSIAQEGPPGSPGALGASASEPALGSSPAKKSTAASDKVKAFVQRQTRQNAASEAKQSFTELQRLIVRHTRESDQALFTGAKGVEGFRRHLQDKYGSVVAGWRMFDQDANGKLAFYEFVNGCRRMGYHGNLKRLWRELDKDQSGQVSLMEIDPEVGRCVGTFKLALMREYGDMLTAWQKGLDVNGSGRIEEREIEDCVKRLNLDLDGAKLFRMLRSTHSGSLGMTLSDFDPTAYNRWLSGDVHGFNSSTANMEFLHDLPEAQQGDLPEDATAAHRNGGAKQWRRQLRDQDMANVRAVQEQASRLRLGLHTAAGFKKALVGRCGSLFAAWRESLDLDGNGRLTFGEFSQALQRLGLHGNIKGLWKELGGEQKGYLLFADLDPETDAVWSDLREKLAAEYGNMLLAWLNGFDAKGSGSVFEEQFVKVCEKVGLSAEAAAQIFRLLMPGAGRRSLALKQVDPQAYLALTRGDFRMLSDRDGAPKSSKKPTELTFDERQQTGFNYQMQQAWDVATREEFAKSCRADIPEHDIDTAEEFELLCRRTYGSIIGAWRGCLDYDANGKLTFNEFCPACRRLGYRGDLRALWNKYDSDKKGWLALSDLDAEADELVSSFLTLLREKFGDLDKGWRLGFGKDPHECVDEDILRDACASLEYPHSAHKLFRCLQPVPGRQLITIWDLDPLCTRKRQRGDTAFYAQPKDVMSKVGKQRSNFTPGEDAFVAPAGPHDTNTIAASTPTKQQLRQVLKNRFGSTAAAWRGALDPAGQGGAAFGRFSLVLEECAFNGNRKALWQELVADPESGARAFVTFKDIDAGAAKLLEGFREQLLGKFGCLLESWHQGLAASGLGSLGKDDFAKACADLGLESRNPAKLFQSLLARHGQRGVTCEDLRALLIGVPPAEQGAAWMGAPQAAAGTAEGSGDEGAGGGGGSSPPSPQSARPSYPQSPAGAELSPLAHVAKVNEEHHSQHKDIKDLAGFKKLLVQRYGSLFAAWRGALDADQNGVVTRSDFAAACRHLGVTPVRQLWSELDADENGQISLKEVDAEVGEAFAALEQKLVDEHGGTEAGWRKAFDPEGKVMCDLPTFKAQCEKLGLPGDAEKLFRQLRPEPGRSALAYGDLWFVKDNSNKSPGGR